MCADDNVLTDKKKLDNARSCSVIVEVSEKGHGVIGVRLLQCYHAIMDNSEHVVFGVRTVQCYKAIMSDFDFSTFGPNFILVPISTCSQFQLVVKLYELIVIFPVAIFCTLLHRETCHLRCCAYRLRDARP